MGTQKTPKDEIGWVGYYNTKKELVFVLTSKKNSTEWFYLYEVCGDKLKKLGKSHSPTELERKFNVDKKLRDMI